MKTVNLHKILPLMALLFIFTHSPIFAEESQSNKEALIAAIDSKVTSIKNFEKQNPLNLKVFKCTDTDSGTKLTQLQKVPTEMPDDAIFVVYVLETKEGKALSHDVIPSDSGDWFARFTHYFDDAERTMMFEFYSTTFKSGCQVRKKYYFDDNSTMIKHEVIYTDRDNKPTDKPCDYYGIQREEPKIYHTYKEVVTATKNSRAPYAKEEPYESKTTRKSLEQYFEQRQQWDNKEVGRINRNRAKIRFVLYVVSALSFTIALILFIRNKIKIRNKTKN